MLNDPQFFEAAAALARNVIAGGTSDPLARLDDAFHRTLARRPTPDEAAVLLDLLRRRLAYYRGLPGEAEALVGGPAGAGEDAADLAAWTNVANAIFNLDELLVRE